MRRTALFLGGLFLATGASLALAGPASAADAGCKRDCDSGSGLAVVHSAPRPVILVDDDDDECYYGGGYLSSYGHGGGYIHGLGGGNGYWKGGNTKVISNEANQFGLINAAIQTGDIDIL